MITNYFLCFLDSWLNSLGNNSVVLDGIFREKTKRRKNDITHNLFNLLS